MDTDEKEKITHNDETERIRQESSEIQHLSEAVMQLVENGRIIDGDDEEKELGASDTNLLTEEEAEKEPGINTNGVPGAFPVSEGTTELEKTDLVVDTKNNNSSDADLGGGAQGEGEDEDESIQAEDGSGGDSMLRSQEVEEEDQGGLQATSSDSEGQESETNPEPVPLTMLTSPLSIAVMVSPEEEEERVLQRVLDQAVRADVIVPTGHPPEEASPTLKQMKNKKCLLIVGALLILGLAVGLGVGLTQNTTGSSSNIMAGDGENSSTPQDETPVTKTPTLQAVRERGVLRCGLPDVFYLINYNADGERVGFEIDLCKAFAAGILGDKSKHELIDVPMPDRFTTLASGSIDLFFRAAPTMGRDVHEESSGVGFLFSYPYYYGGVGFGGKELFVKCADALNTRDECSDLIVCTGPGTTHTELLKGLIPSAHILILFAHETMPAFMEGRCNVIFADVWDLALVLLNQDTFGTGHAVGEDLTHEALSIVTRDGDAEWSDMVNWILQSLFEAEKLGITQDSAGDFKTTAAFGVDHENLFRNAVAAAGNYGEIYDRHVESTLSRSGMLMLNTNRTSGILWTPGIDQDVAITGPEPILGGELERVSRKAYLTCGITDARPGMAEFNSTTGVWSGLDVDFCRAVGSSIFFGLTSDEKVRFVEFENVEDGYKSLADRSSDILCGQRVTLGADVAGYGSGEGASFSLPYFYDPEDGANRALAVRQSDVQWSSFVYWIVACTIYAEVENIMRTSANEMPVVNLFGSGYRRMFRDAILAVGNYGEMYNRNLESLIPRSGLNLLNVDPVGPQIFPLPFDDSAQ